MERVARLRLVGLKAGSTVIEVERVSEDGTLEFDLEHEQGFDAQFSEIIVAIGSDSRPANMSDSIAETAGDLLAALRKAAPEVEFGTAGVVRQKFKTADTHRETWRSRRNEVALEPVTVVGRLYAVNLKSHRLQIQDDVGNEFALPKVDNDSEVGYLLGGYVSVTGEPERDLHGRLTQIHGAVIVSAPQLVAGVGVRESVSLDEILAAAPGPIAGAIPGLTGEEADAFYEALRA